VSPSTLDHNYSYGPRWTATGGAAYFESSYGVVSSCIFKANRAGDRGGGLATSFSQMHLTGCKFVSNIVAYEGGAVYMNGGTAAMDMLSFTFNSVIPDSRNNLGVLSLAAGAMMLNGTRFSIRRCVFTANSAIDRAGAIYLMYATGVIYSCIFKSNTATAEHSRAGGVDIWFSFNVLLDFCVFDSNIAYDGGAVTIETGSAGTVVLNTVILNNVALTSGGGVFISQAASAVLLNVSLQSNAANIVGGGVNIEATPDVRIINSTILYNVGGDNSYKITDINREGAGGVGVSGTTTIVSIVSSIIAGNSVREASGGGLLVTGGSVSLTDCVIANNSATGPSFKLIEGTCQVYGGCFTSPNYPADYSNTFCEIEAENNGSLVVSAFNTNLQFGLLDVANVTYSGIVGPECVDVEEGHIISWDPGPYSNRLSSGFEVCYAKTASGGGLYMIEGSFLMTGGSVENNRATYSGGGFYIGGGSVNVFGVQFASNVVLEKQMLCV